MSDTWNVILPYYESASAKSGRLVNKLWVRPVFHPTVKLGQMLRHVKRFSGVAGPRHLLGAMFLPLYIGKTERSAAE